MVHAATFDAPTVPAHFLRIDAIIERPTGRNQLPSQPR